jgi:chorismate dehydratase
MQVRTMNDEANPPLRVGAVNYLNSKPLIEGLAEEWPGLDRREAPDSPSPGLRKASSPGHPRLRLVLDYPSRLALVPSITCLLAPHYEVVSDACVAARGPVMSVKLYFRVPPAEVRTLALDEGSRTSAALARILLAQRFGAHPDLEPLSLESALDETAADAVLLIGDRAMHAPAARFHTTWDLGEAWFAWTGLPFVFAMWATRAGTDLGDFSATLSAARDLGVKDAERIARREARILGIPERTATDYLTRNLHFTLGPAERQGLALFHKLALELGLAPEGVDLVFRDCVAVG